MSLPSVSHDSEDDRYIVGFISICFALKSIPSSFLVVSHFWSTHQT